MARDRSDDQVALPRRSERSLIRSIDMKTSLGRENEKVLKTAFATSDLRQICKAVDAAIVRGGIAKVAESARVDRATIYRAFRRENGPALRTMVKVLHVLGMRLIVKIKPDPSEGSRLDAKATAHSLTRAFRSGNLDLAVEALAKTLRSQENIAELARSMVLSRENLYRSFAFPRTPRFRTALIFLNTLELQFGVERLPSKEIGDASQRPAGQEALTDRGLQSTRARKMYRKKLQNGTP